MALVTQPGFYDGRFRQGGQFTEADVHPAEAPDLDGLTRDDLVALAKERGVQHSASATKGEIVAALQAAS